MQSNSSSLANDLYVTVPLTPRQEKGKDNDERAGLATFKSKLGSIFESSPSTQQPMEGVTASNPPRTRKGSTSSMLRQLSEKMPSIRDMLFESPPPVPSRHGSHSSHSSKARSESGTTVSDHYVSSLSANLIPKLEAEDEYVTASGLWRRVCAVSIFPCAHSVV